MASALALSYGRNMPLDAAAWVFQVRDATGLSQELFAEHINASRSAVVRWETGVNEPEYKNVAAIIAAFPESAALLAGSSDARPSAPMLKTMEAREVATVVDEQPVIKRIYLRDMIYRVLGRGREPEPT